MIVDHKGKSAKALMNYEKIAWAINAKARQPEIQCSTHLQI
jgi:hypothetical protein